MEARAGVEPTYTDLQPHGALGARIAAPVCASGMERLEGMKCAMAARNHPTVYFAGLNAP